MPRNMLVIFACMLISDWANVLLKLGATQVSFVPTPSKILGAFTNPYLVSGFLLYGVGAVLWLTVLAQNRFSTVVLFFSIHYIHLLLVSRIVFKEPITWNMWAGSVLIVIGVSLISLANAPVKQL